MPTEPNETEPPPALALPELDVVALELLDDPATIPDQIKKLRDRFGLKQVVMVGDRGMITAARIRDFLAGKAAKEAAEAEILSEKDLGKRIADAGL